MVDVYKGLDPRDIPTYSFGETAHYLRIPVATLRSWVRGRSYQTEGGKQFSQPLIELPSPEAKELSFTNLVEAHVLRAIRVEHRIPTDRIRTALDYINSHLGIPHALFRSKFKTDGVELFLEHSENLLTVSKGGQIAIKETLDNYLQRIEVDEAGLAARYFPFTRSNEEDAPKKVVIDPRISFGRPVLVGTGIPTAILAERYKAGELIDELADDYGCDRLLVEEAIRYELPMPA